ncbi:metallophosphoesterase [archaeon]|jgi:uncharacterized protein|nr:metallophosphoesterase [archaeon]MBT4241267.1 metallophosphoesterase [archaeon]MBT4418089.1 metallophosphoesterase [archaeon]
MVKKNNKPKIRFLNDCLLIDNEILVIGDIHIGYEEHIAQEGIIPRIQYKEIVKKLDKIFLLLDKGGIKIKKIILLGDLKHEFGGISNSEWRETLQLLDYLDEKIDKKNKGNRIVLIKGNHDNILGPIARKRNVKLKKYYSIRGICFLHGNKVEGGCCGKGILVMGHLHPSISLGDNYKKEKYKCFLKGKWNRKIVYILPSFSGISLGYDLRKLNEKMKEERSGMKTKNFVVVENKALRNFEIIIYNEKDENVLNFGKLRKMK